MAAGCNSTTWYNLANENMERMLMFRVHSSTRSYREIGVTSIAAATALVFGAVLMQTVDVSANETAVSQEIIDAGKNIAWDRKKGNCLACHAMADGSLPGNAGPALISMKQRFPDKAALRAQIWDATQRNPNTVMPPFGRHGILTDDEVDKITEYVYTL
jgi:sulfur-oxidizing protein SoxX